ncbi:DUF763 domain-containing protein [Candidatus Bathyarchaeota archaeon]|nr:DUF763 domain-containing protein [Candidatus Bathyarchaeota archaeon]
MSKASAILPLHPGKAPKWLFNRMVKLAKCLTSLIIEEYGLTGYLERLSDPWFFQSLSCVLGYDWHSSGTTTVTCGALKEAIIPSEIGLAIAGGKGRTSRQAPLEIKKHGESFGLSTLKIDELVYSSKIAAKVDNNLIQDGYQLYHHCFIFDENGHWIVIQQGINHERVDARRYHWPIEHNGFIDEPQNAIICNSHLDNVLDLTSKFSYNNREVCVDLVKERTDKIEKMIIKTVKFGQSRLDGWNDANCHDLLVMPRSVNWDTLRALYEFQPSNYEELVAFQGVGPSTIRGLSLISELIYGEKASWNDPVRFNFAFGGKDGVPYPVNRKAMDEATELLKTGIINSDIKNEEKKRALINLRKCVPPIPTSRMFN